MIRTWPRPPIELAGLFRTEPVTPPAPAPAWWPNDKQLVAEFIAPRGPVNQP